MTFKWSQDSQVNGFFITSEGNFFSSKLTSFIFKGKANRSGHSGLAVEALSFGIFLNRSQSDIQGKLQFSVRFL